MKTAAAIQFFIQSRRALKLSPPTIDWYSHRLARFAGKYPRLPDDPTEIEEFLSGIEGEENAHGYYRTLKAFYRFLNKRYQLPNPIDLIELRHPSKTDKPTLEPEQLFQLLSCVSSLRDRALLTLLVDTGIRAAELASLKRQHILTEEVRVLGKTGWRNVPISEETRRLLLALVAQNGHSDYVFQGERGPLRRYGVYRVVSKYMKMAGIARPKLGPHRVRHAFAKTYLMNGGDLRSLQDIMGHSNISTTEEYLKYANKEAIRKHHMFTPLLAVRAAAQARLLPSEASEAVREAERILERQYDYEGSDPGTG